MNEFCKICDSKTFTITHKKFGIDYYYCKACGFIAKDERSIISPEEELKIYESHNNSIDDPRYVAFFKRFLESAVFPYCKGETGLDYGSGPSPVLATILERDYGFSVDIYDLFFSPEREYEGRSYDLITATEVLEHLADPLSHFAIFRRCLKDEGILSVMTLFHPEDENEFLQWYYMRDMSHISFYTPRSMRVIGEKLGLEIIFTDDARYTTFRKRY